MSSRAAITVTVTDLMFALSQHVGAERAISANELWAKITGDLQSTHDQRRALRNAVEQARSEGKHVISQPGGGYYLARDDEELKTYCEKRRTSLMKELLQIAAMQRVSLADLVGQKRLPT